jgi:predicted RNase H-like HicB family nuclease
MTEYAYTVVIERDEDGAFIAHCPSLPGCSSYGVTREEALANIREAMVLTIEVLRERGEHIPPDDVQTETVAVAV